GYLRRSAECPVASESPGHNERRWARNMLVDFFIVGTQKAGTSALDRYLRQFRTVQMANVKEIHFFDDEDMDWSKPITRDFTSHSVGIARSASSEVRRPRFTHAGPTRFAACINTTPRPD